MLNNKEEQGHKYIERGKPTSKTPFLEEKRELQQRASTEGSTSQSEALPSTY